MKTVKTIILIVIMIIPYIGRTQTNQKINVFNSIEMEANIDKVWTVISDLSNFDTIVPEIISETNMIGNGKGSVVSLTLTSTGDTVIEEVILLDNKKRWFAYKMLETPMPISEYEATIKLYPLVNSSFKVVFDAVLSTSKENRETMENAISNFQKTFLNNLKKQYNEK